MNSATRARIEAFFLARDEHSLFCLLCRPSTGVKPSGTILHVPAFAEEMNKSRRAVATTARAMAERGWVSLILDPHGTGDSSGDFGDATWHGWLQDVRAAARWLSDQFGEQPALWGLRSGCLLINDILGQVPCSRLIFWQPPLSGEAALTQFLRLRTVGSIAQGDGTKETIKGLLGDLEAGHSLEIAGYVLAPALALPLRQARLGGAHYNGKAVDWLEISASDPPAFNPASNTRISELRAEGALVRERAVSGINFWTTQEIDEGAALVSATISHCFGAP